MRWFEMLPAVDIGIMGKDMDLIPLCLYHLKIVPFHIPTICIDNLAVESPFDYGLIFFGQIL